MFCGFYSMNGRSYLLQPVSSSIDVYLLRLVRVSPSVFSGEHLYYTSWLVGHQTLKISVGKTSWFVQVGIVRSSLLRGRKVG
jgi:hypothetical protein